MTNIDKLKQIYLKIFVVAMSLCAIVSCKKDNLETTSIISNLPEIASLIFNTQNNTNQLTANISCNISGDTVSGYYPLNTDPSKLTATLTTNKSNLKILVNGVQTTNTNSISTDFSKPVKIELIDDSLSNTYIVNLIHFTGLPIVYITTNGNAAITSKEDSVVGSVKIDSNSTAFASYSGNAYYFVHGNSTAGFPKTPYKMVLMSKSPILGMNTAKNWILLANYDDKTLLRNYLALQLGRIFGMQWTPSSQFVEVVLNGTYVGNYQITEEVQVDKSRLNINEMSESDNTGNKLTGGYLLEADNKMEDMDHVRFNTSALNNSLLVHSPSPITSQQLTYINNYVDSAEVAMYNSNFTDSINGYRKYIDPISFVNYFWINELSRNNDADFWSSTFMYKDKDSLLKMGPIWDFDIAFGNTSYNNNYQATGWFMATNGIWFSQLLKDPYFKNLTIAQWKLKRSSLDSLNVMIDAMSQNLNESQKQNFIVWPILNTVIQGASPQAYGTYSGEINYLKQWITQRLAWIDTNINTL